MRYQIKNMKDLEKFAKEFSKYVKAGDVFSLVGDLGAGKTSFVQFVGKYLGIKDYITSPTFSILNVYRGEIGLNHADFYRLEDEREIEALDYEAIMYPEGEISFIEWAEKVRSYMPDDAIEIFINYEYEGRSIEISDKTLRGRYIGDKINESFGN
ncbi:tRNA (adenosine(37)-N6)-threonylcarbamoyltransferase complex ATPase subunit type 1 TsaE [Peptoniphilaceae bacterium SGI.131]